MRIQTIFTGLLVALGAAAFGCSGSNTGISQNHLSCTETADCSISGGSCVDNVCHADNECATDADCAPGETCAPATGFEGLCTAAGAPPAPLPPWACSVGADCPQGQGCSSDGMCHVDGECHNHWTPEGYLEGDCGGDLLCAAPTPGGLDGFCTDERNGPDPYCRSDGHGACRSECASDDDCGGGTCDADGFCHPDGECTTDADCSPNHICTVPEGWEDYGYSLCVDDPSPTCVDDGHGACRLACETDLDCLHGGGCSADGLCHASNECAADSDCDTGLICYADDEFGGLCGPPRPPE